MKDKTELITYLVVVPLLLVEAFKCGWLALDFIGRDPVTAILVAGAGVCAVGFAAISYSRAKTILEEMNLEGKAQGKIFLFCTIVLLAASFLNGAVAVYLFDQNSSIAVSFGIAWVITVLVAIASCRRAVQLIEVQ